jgi:hypothetical protein
MHIFNSVTLAMLKENSAILVKKIFRLEHKTTFYLPTAEKLTLNQLQFCCFLGQCEGTKNVIFPSTWLPW